MLARIRKSAEEKDQGFTLIELLVVIIIIGILAAIAIPVFLNQRKKGWDSQAKSDARNLATLEETFFTDANNYVVGSSTGTAPTLAIAGLSDYKSSANVISVVINGYKSDGTAAASNAEAVGGFCVLAESKSGNKFAYNSVAGGLQPGASPSTTCPATVTIP
jgi:type IV pilus assembly protein PilA